MTATALPDRLKSPCATNEDSRGLAQELNRSCFCISLDRHAMADAMRGAMTGAPAGAPASASSGPAAASGSAIPSTRKLASPRHCPAGSTAWPV